MILTWQLHDHLKICILVVNLCIYGNHSIIKECVRHPLVSFVYAYRVYLWRDTHQRKCILLFTCWYIVHSCKLSCNLIFRCLDQLVVGRIFCQGDSLTVSATNSQRVKFLCSVSVHRWFDLLWSPVVRASVGFLYFWPVQFEFYLVSQL